MSSKIDFNGSAKNLNNSIEWNVFGTARAHFEETCKDDYLKEQINLPSLNQTLKKLKRLFSEINIGSEIFYQSVSFLISFFEDNKKEKITNQRFLVLLSGLLFMREANIYGSSCIPWEILKPKIASILQRSGISKKEFRLSFWKKWLLGSFVFYKYSESKFDKGTIFVEKNSLIYFYKNWLYESELMNLIKERLKLKLIIPQENHINNSIRSVLETDPGYFGGEKINLSAEQKKAISLAITSPFLIITGGPGTGKTSLAVVLLRVLKLLGLAENPSLIAPTGMAAKRMYESVFSSLNSIKKLSSSKNDQELLKVAAKAKTLHRLLGYSHSLDKFKYHQFEPLDNDLLIVDEGSMIDQRLMTSLLKSANSKLTYHPSVSRIILLGDPDQLPSVGSGAILSGLTSLTKKNDTHDSKINLLKIVRLSRSFRQKIENPSGRNILGIAEKINNTTERKNLNLLFEKKSPNNLEVIKCIKKLEDVTLEKVSFICQNNSINHLKDFAKWWLENFLSKERFFHEIHKEFRMDEFDLYQSNFNYIFKYLSRFRILTVTQVFSTGAKFINQIIRELWLSKKYTNNMVSEHYPGEPIMVTKNDYMLNLFNGDVGVFLKFFNPDSRKSELRAVFQVDGVFKMFLQNELPNIQTAYAITVHKSQGSEYDNLALILPNLSIKSGDLYTKNQNFKEILTSQMLYTALTRAKKSVLILGKRSILEFFVLNKYLRFSGLSNYML